MNDDLALLDSTAGDGAAASADSGASLGAPTDAGVTSQAEESPAAVGTDSGAESSGDGSEQPAETPSYEVEYPEDEEAEESGQGAEGAETAKPAEQTEGAAEAGSGRYGVAALDKLLKENEPLRQVLDANPRVRSHFFHLARRAQELEQFQTIVPTPARAREVVGKAQQLDGLDRLYYGDNPQEFLEHLREASYLRDPQNPDAYQLDPVTKQPISNGAYEKTAQFMNQTFLDALDERAQASGNENLQDAVKTIRDALRWSPSSPARDGQGRFRSNEDDNLSPEIRQQLERGRAAARELEELRRRRSEEAGQSSQQFMSGVGAEVRQGLHDFVGGLLAKTSFSDYDKEKIAEDFINEMSALGDQDTVHAAALDDIFRQGGLTQQTRQQAVRMALSWARRNGAPVLETIIKKAGGSIRSAQAQRQAVQAQAAATRREPVAGGRPAAPQRLDLRQQVTKIQKDTGRRLSDLEILNLE